MGKELDELRKYKIDMESGVRTPGGNVSHLPQHYEELQSEIHKLKEVSIVNGYFSWIIFYFIWLVFYDYVEFCLIFCFKLLVGIHSLSFCLFHYDSFFFFFFCSVVVSFGYGNF